MQSITLQQLAGDTDIYLLDQVLKGRYGDRDHVLDAGCGTGRNLHWFLYNHLICFGSDSNPEVIDQLHLQYPGLPAERFIVAPVEALPFVSATFDHVISSAVLHFAQHPNHFDAMLTEMVRVLKRGGSLFIRMASNIGIENAVIEVGEGIYALPDGSYRYLLTRPMLQRMLAVHQLACIEPIKTVNVEDMRCMTTLVLLKL